MQPSDTPNSAELLTVIVPCLNEEDSIVSTTEEIYAELERIKPVELRVILCDDGSTDRTGELIEGLCERFPNCRMLQNPKNMGLGMTVKRAYDLVEPNSWVTVLPGDGEIVFASIHEFLKHRDEADLILGYLRNPVIRTFKRRLASSAYNGLANWLYGFDFRYFNGFKMYRLEVFKGIDIVASGHATTVELIAKAVLRQPSLRIMEVPFVWRARHARDSHAFKPSSIVHAVLETQRAYQSVSEFRQRQYVDALEATPDGGDS